ncbi:expressed unknown protein [Seminavis robusta]|uniref:Transmembrane protein n=1 Tax=Seminavis robusta TaxID=568900 RepID=A0A9N8DYV4_9STRA|nr:expressed unknown protein [Seminavis robusta]|eukprot:Sro456_g146680.1 n/a (681) ;mRNA; f:38072-40114
MTFLVCSEEVDGATFGILFTATLLSSWVAGSTYQWVVEKGLFRKNFLQKENQYNVLVGISALTANLQAIGCFLNAVVLQSDDNNDSFGLTTALSINMILMTHTSLMLISRRVSLTYPNAEQMWERLLRINLAMLPVSFIGATIWATSHLHPEKQGWQRANHIFVPLSIGLWGLAEAILSSHFVIQMSRYQWTEVQHKGMAVLAFVALCDILCLVLAILFGDLTAMCLWGLLYSVRVRLEVRVMNSMIEYIQAKRAATMYKGRSNRRRRRKKRNNSESGLDFDCDDGDSDAGSVSSRGSIFSRMPNMVIHPNDLTQLFKANFFNDVLTGGRTGFARSLQSLASFAKKSRHGGKSADVCPKCSRRMMSDELTLGSFRSNRSFTFKNVLSGDVGYCCCEDDIQDRANTENTVRDSGTSSFLFVSPPPVREIRLGSTTLNDNIDSSSNHISDMGNSNSRALDYSGYSQQRGHRVVRSLNMTSESHQEANEEEEDEEETLKSHSDNNINDGKVDDRDNDSTRGSFVLRFSGEVVDLSDFVLSSDEDDSDSSSSDEDTSPDSHVAIEPLEPPASISNSHQKEQSAIQSSQEDDGEQRNDNVAVEPLVVGEGGNVDQVAEAKEDTTTNQDVGTPLDIEHGVAELPRSGRTGHPNLRHLSSFNKQDSTCTLDGSTREQLKQLRDLDCL